MCANEMHCFVLLVAGENYPLQYITVMPMFINRVTARHVDNNIILDFNLAPSLC